MVNSRCLRSILFGTVAVLSINAAAAAQDNRISLQEQPLSDALRSVAQKTGESILFTPESVEGLRAPAISGEMSAQQAVSLLTRGTDLEVVADGNNGLIVRRPFMRRAVEQVPQTVAGGAAPVETVVVSGFRSSLEQSLDMKRRAMDSSDSILAEDIAKFPDLNVSESLQRIPGITLARDQGEGRQISVRGLNSTFTRVRINGMEALGHHRLGRRVGRRQSRPVFRLQCLRFGTVQPVDGAQDRFRRSGGRIAGRHRRSAYRPSFRQARLHPRGQLPGRLQRHVRRL
jgi:hypothetical protein